MPSSTLDEFVDRYATVSLANQRVLSTFAALARHFHQQAVDFLVLKGGDLIPRLYGLAGVRPLSDIDLLVRPQDLPALHALLLDQGYEPLIDGNPAYRSSDGTLLLDVVSHLWYLDDHRDLWARRAPLMLHGVEAWGLGTSDLILHVIAYSVLHRGEVSAGLRADLRLLLAKEQPDWDLVLRLAQETGLRIPLRHGLGSVDSAQLPSRILDALDPKTKVEQAQSWLLRKLVTDNPLPNVGHFLMLLFTPRGKLVAKLAQTFLPSRDFLAWRYGAAGVDRPAMTGLRRCLSLVAQGCRLMVLVVRRIIVSRQT